MSMDSTDIENVMALGKSIGRWGDELQADPRDQLPAVEVQSALNDIRIDALLTTLPGVLGELQRDATARIKHGNPPVNFVKVDLLRKVENAIFELSQAAAKRSFSRTSS